MRTLFAIGCVLFFVAPGAADVFEELKKHEIHLRIQDGPGEMREGHVHFKLSKKTIKGVDLFRTVGVPLNVQVDIVDVSQAEEFFKKITQIASIKGLSI